MQRELDPLQKTNGTWPPPAEINDEHKVYSIAVFIAISCIVTGFVVLWRLWSRFKTQSFGVDDYAIIPAVVRVTAVDRRALLIY